MLFEREIIPCLPISTGCTEKASGSAFVVPPLVGETRFLTRRRKAERRTRISSTPVKPVLIPIYIEHTALAAFLKNGYEVSELSRAGV
jgi:hypothetical protein